MLILTRKCGESIVIDGKLEIKITDISEDKVKVGIEAPADIRIYRKELYDTLQENRSAAGNTAAAQLLQKLTLDPKKAPPPPAQG